MKLKSIDMACQYASKNLLLTLWSAYIAKCMPMPVVLMKWPTLAQSQLELFSVCQEPIKWPENMASSSITLLKAYRQVYLQIWILYRNQDIFSISYTAGYAVYLWKGKPTETIYGCTDTKFSIPVIHFQYRPYKAIPNTDPELFMKFVHLHWFTDHSFVDSF